MCEKVRSRQSLCGVTTSVLTEKISDIVSSEKWVSVYLMIRNTCQIKRPRGMNTIKKKGGVYHQ